MASLERNGKLTMLTKGMLLAAIEAFGGSLNAFLADMTGHYHYIEAQVWDDACLNLKTPS